MNIHRADGIETLGLIFIFQKNMQWVFQIRAFQIQWLMEPSGLSLSGGRHTNDYCTEVHTVWKYM